MLVLPQIGDTLDADNQLPGGLFQALALDHDGEVAVLTHFPGYERIRTCIEEASLAKHFERFAFAMTDVKERYRPYGLPWLLNETRNDIGWLLAYAAAALPRPAPHASAVNRPSLRRKLMNIAEHTRRRPTRSAAWRRSGRRRPGPRRRLRRLRTSRDRRHTLRTAAAAAVGSRGPAGDSTTRSRTPPPTQALTIDSVLVENNVDAAGKDADDHLEIAVTNIGTTPS